MKNHPYKIYNASAGSGKTYTLTINYLCIILSAKNSSAYRKILAITFTNKAVNEMKTRIIESLYTFSLTATTSKGNPMFAQVAKLIGVDEKQLRDRAKKTLKHILHNYSFFEVSTIDKFTHGIIRVFAKDLKLPQNFEVIINANELLNEAINRLLYKAGNDKKLTQVLLDFALEKIDDDKSWDIGFDLLNTGKLLFQENEKAHLNALSKHSLNDFEILKSTLKKTIVKNNTQLTTLANSILDLIKNNGLEETDFTRGSFPKFMKQIAEGDAKIEFEKAQWKHDITVKPLYPSKASPTAKQSIDDLLPQFHSIFETIKTTFYERELYANSYKNIVPLTVLSAIQQELKLLETEDNKLPLAAFNEIIANEIKNQPAPFIYERLGEKYRHYFIDEFQDTSALQWNNLVPLIGNALESLDENETQGSVLLVGDAKQAIYRWRGGKAEQFLNLINETDSPFVYPPKTEQLETNWRSHEEIITFNNNFFTHIQQYLEHEGYKELYVTGNQQGSNHKKGGLVQFNFIDDTDKDTDSKTQYCQEVLERINDLTSNAYQYEDICILTRTKAEGITIANYLMQEKIPVISSETLLINASKEVQFLVALLHLANTPNDKGAAYQVLYYLHKNKPNTHDKIQEHLSTISEHLETDFNFKLKKLQQSSVFDGLEYAINTFNLITSSNAHVTYFMDTVLDIEERFGTSIHAFLTYWENEKINLSISAPENVNAIQLMTVHKSKGLEFPVVIYPFAKSSMKDDKDGKIWLPTTDSSLAPFTELLLSRKKEAVYYSETAKYLYEEEDKKLELDAINVLYVVLTRAEKALYIITEKSVDAKGAPNTGNYAGLFISFLQQVGTWNESQFCYTFGTLPIAKTDNQEQKQVTVAYQKSNKSSASFSLLTSSGTLWAEEKTAAIDTGQILHDVLDSIQSAEDIAPTLQLFQHKGLLTATDSAELEKQIISIVTHPELQLYYKKTTVFKNEAAIVTAQGKVVRPDRLVFFDNEVVILDYKTGKKDTKYSQQITTYAQALSAMGYTVTHKILIYINDTITLEYI